jgi:hypothetical protein
MAAVDHEIVLRDAAHRIAGDKHALSLLEIAYPSAALRTFEDYVASTCNIDLTAFNDFSSSLFGWCG